LAGVHEVVDVKLTVKRAQLVAVADNNVLVCK